MWDILSIVLFIFSVLCYIGVAIVALRNDPTSIVNRMFALVFSIFSLAALGFSLPIFIEWELTNDLFALVINFIGVFFLFVGFFFLAMTGKTVKQGSDLLKDSQEYYFPLIVFALGLSSLLIQFLAVDSLMGLLGFILMFVSFGLLGEKGTSPIMEIANQTEDVFLKKKLRIWGFGVLIFGILSAIGWFSALSMGQFFEDLLGDEKAVMILPAFATFIGAGIMFYSFIIKPTDESSSENKE